VIKTKIAKTKTNPAANDRGIRVHVPNHRVEAVLVTRTRKNVHASAQFLNLAVARLENALVPSLDPAVLDVRRSGLQLLPRERILRRKSNANYRNWKESRIRMNTQRS
jgi:hypothetical protein